MQLYYMKYRLIYNRRSRPLVVSRENAAFPGHLRIGFTFQNQRLVLGSGSPASLPSTGGISPHRSWAISQFHLGTLSGQEPHPRNLIGKVTAVIQIPRLISLLKTLFLVVPPLLLSSSPPLSAALVCLSCCGVDDQTAGLPSCWLCDG